MMKVINLILSQCAEELDDAEDYIEGAIVYADSDKALANLYYDLSTEEIAHFEKLFEICKMQMKIYSEKADQGIVSHDSYKAAHTIFDYEKDKLLRVLAEVRVKISLYK